VIGQHAMSKVAAPLNESSKRSHCQARRRGCAGEGRRSIQLKGSPHGDVSVTRKESNSSINIEWSHGNVTLL
jgi:hypothetical protein